VPSTSFNKNISKFLKEAFSLLSGKDISELINFLYPAQDGVFEDIFNNKAATFALLDKVFDSITAQGKFVLAADNFDMIDGLSYEFIHNFIRKENIYEKLKLILLYADPNPGKKYFYFPDESIYVDINLAPLENIEPIIQQKTLSTEGFEPPVESDKIFAASQGNYTFVENALALYFESMIYDKPFAVPQNMSELISKRLEILREANPAAYNLLVAAAVLGDKINLLLLEQVSCTEDFQDIIEYLEKSDYITSLNNTYYEFKSTTLWETIYGVICTAPGIEQINGRIYEFLTNVTTNSLAVLAVVIAVQNREAFEIWTKISRLSAQIGDVNLYLLSQKQCLALLNEFDDAETLDIRFNIHERIGELLSYSNPAEAMDYLPDAISNAQSKGDDVKEIKLLAYMSSCCRAVGNYHGEIECVDKVLKKIPPVQTLDIALVNTTKLQALLHIGNCGEIVNLVDNTIMPVFEECFNRKRQDVPFMFVFEAWIQTYLVLANALILQGSERVHKVLEILSDIINRYNIKEDLFICKYKIALAAAHTLRGELKCSNDTLKETLETYKNIMDSPTLLRMDLVNIINRFLKKEYDNIQERLFNIVVLADNSGDNFTKHILKILLGKAFMDKEQVTDALNIYNEEITRFANEKIATGAMLAWYLIAEASLNTNEPDKAENIAAQALDVALNPKIDNYTFAILFRIILAKAYMVKSDFDSAKIHIETALTLAKRNQLNDLLSEVYLLYGNYFYVLGHEKSPEQLRYLEGSAKMYELATTIITETRNNLIFAKIQTAQNTLRTFCESNNIT